MNIKQRNLKTEFVISVTSNSFLFIYLFLINRPIKQSVILIIILNFLFCSEKDQPNPDNFNVNPM